MRELVRLAEERESRAKAAMAALLESRSTVLQGISDANEVPPGTQPLPAMSRHSCLWGVLIHCFLQACRCDLMHSMLHIAAGPHGRASWEPNFGACVSVVAAHLTMQGI